MSALTGERRSLPVLAAFAGLTPAQRRAFIASLAGWSLDAFDFFVFVFCLPAIAARFRVDIKTVSEGIFLTLAFRPLGSLCFGWLAERFGRKPVLILNVLSFSAMQLATAFAPSLAVLLVLRAAFGFAMGGEWGVGAALALESLPARGRGLFSGVLQQGYMFGNLLASLIFALAFVHVGWRGMFLIGAAAGLLVLYVLHGVQESPTWVARRTQVASARAAGARSIWAHVPKLLYLVVLMACFNAFSHGSQDLYPTFLQSQHRFSPATTGTIAIIVNLGAFPGAVLFGALSERIGRRRAIMLAAALAVPLIPLWAFSGSVSSLALGGFLMQFAVQGAWGIVPAYLIELSPASVRAILPGFAYQLGNLAMSRMAPLQAGLAESHGGDYAAVLGWSIGAVALALILVAALGTEAPAGELEASRQSV
jgi:MFS transporter, SHS family, lactate transporter